MIIYLLRQKSAAMYHTMAAMKFYRNIGKFRPQCN